MAYNKVIYRDETLIDLTGDTVSKKNLAKGVTAHDAKGELIVGEYEGTGMVLPGLQNEANADDLLAGKQLIDGDGNVVTGNIPTKSETDLIIDGATITVPEGYYAEQATKSVTTATQATPSVSIDSNGKITASATQSAGYVTAGTKSGTKQLTTQAAKTITPGTSNQTAVESGVYTTGTVTVAAIPSTYITTTDATASASDVLSGKTAYVNGSKITGTIGTYDGSYECSIDSTGESMGGGSFGTEWKQLSSLPTTYVSAPTQFYLEVPNKVFGYVFAQQTDSMVLKGYIFKTNTGGYLVQGGMGGLSLFEEPVESTTEYDVLLMSCTIDPESVWYTTIYKKT